MLTATATTATSAMCSGTLVMSTWAQRPLFLYVSVLPTPLCSAYRSNTSCSSGLLYLSPFHSSSESTHQKRGKVRVPKV